MKILVLGGTGVISRYVVKKYRDKGHHVTAVNRGNRAKLNIDGVGYRNADANRREELSAVFEGAFYDKVLDFTTFDEETMRMKAGVACEKCGHYVFISSVAVYERREGIGEYTEDMPLGNRSWLYGYQKACCEKALREMFAEKGCRHYTVIRPALTYSEMFVPYSPLDTYHMPGYLIHCLLAGKEILMMDLGEDRMQVMHASDFSENLYHLLNAEGCHGEAYNISGDEYVTSNQIIRRLAELLGVRADVCYLQKKDLQGRIDMEPIVGGWHDAYSNRKAKEILGGYCAGERILDNLEKEVRFFEEYNDWMTWPRDWEERIERVIEKSKQDGKADIKHYAYGNG